ncbi:MAG: uroporphyrinogen-III synthase, partial [Candidatus Acidiferrum sp.]
VTRAAEQSESLVHALEAEGAAVVLVPLVAFGPPDHVGVVDEEIRGAGRYDWMLLTSQNAVRALQERCDALGISLAKAMEGIRIAAVGPATAEAARNAGLTVEYVAVKHQGTALAEELSEKIAGKLILLPRSDRANPELVEKLEGLGARVKEIVAYKTVRPDEHSRSMVEKMVREGADAVVFFSPSAIHHLQDILEDEKFQEFSRRTLFAAIGPVTEEALRKAKAEHVAMAGDTTVGAAIAVLRDYFMAKQLKLPAGASPE